WYFNQTNLLSGQTNSTLTFAAVQLTNDGFYHVVVTDPNTNVVSNPGRITVWDPPVLLSPAPPVRQTITAGDSIVLSVTTSGSLPIGYDFRRNFLKFSTNLVASNSFAITVTNVQPSPATALGTTNTYAVFLTNLASALPGGPTPLLTNIALIKVLNPPVITNQPLTIVTNAGAIATFRVGARGGTPQVIQWYREAAALANQTNTTLNLTNVQVATQGRYSAVI